MILQPQEVGWMEVICGPMFSGKTEELIRRLRRALIAGLSVQSFKPAVDDRYAAYDIASHDGRRIEAVAVPDVDGIRTRVRDDVRVVGIDEVQFFSEDVILLCSELAERGVRVIVAGLDQDYNARPFGPVPRLLAEAEFITKSLSICSHCGNPAHRSHRVLDDGSREMRSSPERANPVAVGAAEAYVPLCRRCFATERDLVTTRAGQGKLCLPAQTARFEEAKESPNDG